MINHLLEDFEGDGGDGGPARRSHMFRWRMLAAICSVSIRCRSNTVTIFRTRSIPHDIIQHRQRADINGARGQKGQLALKTSVTFV